MLAKVKVLTSKQNETKFPPCLQNLSSSGNLPVEVGKDHMQFNGTAQTHMAIGQQTKPELHHARFVAYTIYIHIYIYMYICIYTYIYIYSICICIQANYTNIYD